MSQKLKLARLMDHTICYTAILRTAPGLASTEDFGGIPVGFKSHLEIIPLVRYLAQDTAHVLVSDEDLESLLLQARHIYDKFKLISSISGIQSLSFFESQIAPPSRQHPTTVHPPYKGTKAV